MCKISNFSFTDQENPEKILLRGVINFPIEVRNDSMTLSSFGGIPMLRKEEEHLSIAKQLAGCITDKRNKSLVRHSSKDLIMTRIMQICLGYEDVNDCDRNREEPMMKLAVNGEAEGKDICSSATMCRFENMVTDEDLERIQELFVTMFILSYGGKAPSHIILDCDDTNVDTHGQQEMSIFNTYYDSYCFMPLMVFEGYSGRLILPLLKPGRRNKTANVADTLRWLITTIRAAWPKTTITVRGDSHFCSHELMDWVVGTLQHKVFFITGLAANSVLMAKPIVGQLTEKVRHDYELFKHPVREFGEFYYKAGSWTLPQRVVVKVEMTKAGGQPNIRFIVSNIRSVDARGLYETTYCQRGKDELYIRQFKEGVNGDRLSCHSFNANRFRIFLHGMAYNLMLSFRERALKGTELENATLLTVREKILLTAVAVRVLKTKVVLDYSRSNPMKKELIHAMRFYERAA